MEDFPLHRAAKEGDLNRVRDLIARSTVSVDSCDSFCSTPLHWAARCGHFEVVQHLLLSKCDYNDQENWNSTAVLFAAERGHKDIVNLLVQFGADIDAVSMIGKFTVLHHACKRGWIDTVQRIVDSKKPDLDVKTSLGMTPLMLATCEGHADIVRLLVQGGAQVNLCDDNSWTALHWATSKGCLRVAKVLVEATACKFNVQDSCGNTPLHVACGMNNNEMIEVLLKAGADTDIRNNKYETAFTRSPLNAVVETGDLEWVKHLVSLGMPVNSHDVVGLTPLLRACNKQYEMVEFLIDSNADVNLANAERDGDTPLSRAASCERRDIVDLLVQSGAQINYPSKYDDSLLHWASRYGWLDLVQKVLESGKADLIAVTYDGMTPLMKATEGSHVDVAMVLIKAGADVNAVDEDYCKRTALHYACFEDSAKMFQILLDSDGVDINPQDEDGDTPLHYACKFGQKVFIAMLLTAGANFNIRNNKNQTAFNLLIKKGFILESIRLFIKHGAFFEDCDYMRISKNPIFREYILKDVELCTQSIVNKYNNHFLPAVYNNPCFAKVLPAIKNCELKTQQEQEIKNFMRFDKQINTFCNVMKARPVVLSLLCVQTLLDYQSTTKRSASMDINLPAKKSRVN